MAKKEIVKERQGHKEPKKAPIDKEVNNQGKEEITERKRTGNRVKVSELKDGQ